MKQRLAFLVKVYAVLLIVFVTQKPLFMALDAPVGSSYGLGDYVDVMLHGLELDVPTTGYLIALPWLFTLFSCWWPKRLPVRKVAIGYFLVVAVAVSVVTVVDISLYTFWNFKLDATIFIYMDSPTQAMASVSTLYILWRVVCIVGYAALLTWLLWHAAPTAFSPLDGWKSRVAASAALVVVAVPLGISIRGGVGESTANIGKVYFSDDEFLNHSAVNPCFSLVASLGKSDNYADMFDYYDERKRQETVEGLYRTDTAAPTAMLNTTRPNVLIILMEGFGGQFIECVSGRKDITPNYARLSKEGILFTNCYSNSFRTDRGTVSALSGYAAFPTLSVMKLPIKSRTLPCIAQSLNEAGYSSSFLYGGDINFTNMQSYLRTGGYSNIVSDVDFSRDERSQNPWGANDDVTFDRLLQMINERKGTQWHITFLTLSSHEPFTVPYHRLDDKVANAFAFTDHCLGTFIDKLKKTDAWKNTLIVCLPDHGFQYPSNIGYEEHHHNTMLWLGGAVKEHRVVTTVMNQSDMAATLLAQLCLPHDRYTFSRDVFSASYNRPFAFFTSSETFALVDSTGCTVFGINANRPVEDRAANGKHDEAQTQRRATQAKAIMQTFYDDLGNR